MDKTGTIKAKVWSDNISNIEDACLEEGKVVSIKALVGEFNQVKQLTVFSISHIDEHNKADFLRVSAKDIDEMYEELEDKVDDIQSPEIKGLLEKLLETYEEQIRISPAAASIHHNFVGGLLEHILEMLHIAQATCDLYPEANHDLVTAGIIFHDIGKIFELEVKGFKIDYTTKGKLLGHISIGLKMLNEIDAGILPEKLKTQLEHIILSHHYLLEFGSPVTPKTIEAMIVSKVDDLSSKVRLVQKILENNKENPNEFAPREFGIDGEVYLGN